MKLVQPIVGAAAIIVMATACADEPVQPEPELSGMVELRNEVGEVVTPVANTYVTARSDSETTVVMTDSDGSFVLSGLPAAPHQLKIWRRGYGDVVVMEVPHDSTGVSVVLPAKASVAVAAVEAVVDTACGSQVCLDLVVHVLAEHLFPTGSSRRFFRLYTRDAEVAAPNEYDATTTVFVNVDAPELTINGDVGRIRFDNVRGLLEEHPAPGSIVTVRVHGATENFQQSYPDPTTGQTVYPDISRSWAADTVAVPGGP